MRVFLLTFLIVFINSKFLYAEGSYFADGSYPAKGFSSLNLTEQEIAYLKEKDKITMCIDPDWMPFERIDKGQHVGMTADYLAIMAQKIGKPILLVPTTTWVQTLKFAQTRKCDIFSLAMETENRKKYMDFTQPYLSIPVVIASKTDKFFIPDMSAVGDKKLGVVRGYAIGEILRKEYPEMNIVDVDSLHQGLEMVVKDELYGFIGTMVTVGYEFQRNFVGELKIIGKFDRKWELGIATRNDEPLLKNIFQKTIESISEKQKQEILNQWLAIRYEKAVDYGQLWKWLIVPLVILAFLLYRNFLLKSYNKQLEIISITDKLTQTYNRVKLDDILEQQEALFQRYEQNFSIMIIDIDFFKRVNDQYGHQTGDKVLNEFAKILKDNIRTTDILGRWGGEEFMLISPETNLNDDLILAEKLRKLIQDFSFTSVGALTASFGVSERKNQNDSTLNDLVFQADKALYQAKNEGRNRVVKYSK